MYDFRKYGYVQYSNCENYRSSLSRAKQNASFYEETIYFGRDVKCYEPSANRRFRVY